MTEVKFKMPADHTSDKKYALAYFEQDVGGQVFLPRRELYIVPGYTAGVYNISVGALPTAKKYRGG